MSGDRMTEPKLIWTRGGDGSHWEGCYNTHWDCAIAALRRALDDMVSAIEEGWSGRYLDQKFDRAIDVLNATEEKYDDRP